MGSSPSTPTMINRLRRMWYWYTDRIDWMGVVLILIISAAAFSFASWAWWIRIVVWISFNILVQLSILFDKREI